jgi:1,4-dihydroxy-6-naphthoate synthase
MSEKMKLGHSPDSDDAFMFYGLAKNKVETEGLEFEHILRDIQTLNEWAKEGRLECTAISVHAYAYVKDKYAILSHGASMGDGYGPMLISSKHMTSLEAAKTRIAIPGEMTSAFLALSIYLGQPFEYDVVPFDQIIPAIKDGRYETGLIIHEGQLTHAIDGMHMIADMGSWWKLETGYPLPLGVNAIRKDIPEESKVKASRALKASIVYGLEHRASALEYAMQFARDMEISTADEFVGMYVNDWTIDMGDIGKESIRIFLQKGMDAKLLPETGEIEFVD